MARNDIHRPGAIDPESYDFVAIEFMRLDEIGACFVLQQEREIRTLLESNGLQGDPIKVRALMAMGSPADRMKLIATWTARDRHKPRSSCRLTESTVTSPMPSDARSFAQAIR